MNHCVFAVLFVGLLYPFERTNGKTAVGRYYISDEIPSVPKMTSLSKNNERACAVECAKTKSCNSFSFGLGICNLWNGKYLREDKMMENATGHVYYHFDAMPEATELKLFKEPLTFVDALRSCRKLYQGNLIVIHNKEIGKKLQDLMVEENVKNDEVWIGLNGTVDASGPKRKDGAFAKFDLRWVDGHVLTAGRYNAMAPNNPNMNGFGCWKKCYNGWGDRLCTEKGKYVCQFAPAG